MENGTFQFQIINFSEAPGGQLENKMLDWMNLCCFTGVLERDVRLKHGTHRFESCFLMEQKNQTSSRLPEKYDCKMKHDFF